MDDRLGQVDPDLPVLAQPGLRLGQPGAGRAQPVVVHLAVRRRGVLRGPLLGPGEDLRHPARQLRGTALAAALRHDPLGLDPVRPLPAHVRASGGHRLLRRRLLGGDLVDVRRVTAAVPPDPALAQVADPVHALEQLAVVADHEHRPAPGVDDVVQALPRAGVEVVGRLVEEQHVRPVQQQPREPQLDDLAAGELAHPAAEGALGKAEPGELGDDPDLDVPGVADGVEVGVVGRACVDVADRADHAGDAEELGHLLVRVQGQVLGEVAEPAGHR